MSHEYLGEFLAPIDPGSVSAVLEGIAALEYLEVVRRETYRWGIRFRASTSTIWGEDLSLELHEQWVHLTFPRGKDKAEDRFVRDLLTLLSEQGADCTLVGW